MVATLTDRHNRKGGNNREGEGGGGGGGGGGRAMDLTEGSNIQRRDSNRQEGDSNRQKGIATGIATDKKQG